MLCWPPAGSVAELCKDPEAEAWMLAELNTVGKENKVRAGNEIDHPPCW